MFIRTKRVSDPFDDEAKARFRGVEEDRSSGSEHDAFDPTLFPCLIHDFLRISSDNSSFRGGVHDDDGSVVSSSSAADNNDNRDTGGFSSDINIKTISDILDPSRRSSEPFVVALYADVVRAASAAAREDIASVVGTAYLRSVMTRLRESGYNAGLCKSRWETKGSLTAGRYEYIDVVVMEMRYIVDVGFGGEFEIARATEEYGELLGALGAGVMVGRGEEVRHVVRVMAEGVKRSMGSREMHVPPWRKRRYMLAKWLGPYRRTVQNHEEEEAVSDLLQCARIAPNQAKCVAVGFGINPMVTYGYKLVEN